MGTCTIELIINVMVSNRLMSPSLITISNAIQCYSVLFSVIQCYSVLFSVIQCYSVLFSVIQCYSVLFSVIQCYSVLFSVIQCYSVLFSVTYLLVNRLLCNLPAGSIADNKKWIEFTCCLPVLNSELLKIV